MQSIAKFVAGATLGVATLAASAQTATYPNKPVRLVVPFAGGPIDALARGLAARLSVSLGQPFVIDNQTGGGVVVTASHEVVRSAADGHTLLVTGTGNHNLPPEMAAKLPFNPTRDLVAVSRLVFATNILVARPELGVKTLAEVVALAKARPGQLRVAIPAAGSVTHFVSTLLQRDAGIALTEVIHKGGAPAVKALADGEADLMTASIGAVMAQIQAGKLVPIAVASPQRLALLPEVPTAVEAGLRELVAVNTYGLFAPAGTPKEVVARLNDAVVEAVGSAEFKALVGALGMQAQSSSPEAFETYLRDEAAKWAPLIKAAGAGRM